MTYKPSARDRVEIETMIGIGVSMKDICKIKGIHYNTLRKHFASEIQLGAAKANMRVANKLFALATRENASAAACIFWLKTRAGWREVSADQPGKKEQAEIDARTAEKGTGWAGLLQ